MPLAFLLARHWHLLAQARIDGMSTERRWNVDGTSTERPWNVDGTSMERRWNVDESQVSEYRGSWISSPYGPLTPRPI